MFGSADEKTPLLPSTSSGRRLTSPCYQDRRDLLQVPSVRKQRSQSHQAEGPKGDRSPHSRMRTNSIAVFHDLEDSIISTVSTSYGPVVVIDNAFPGYGGAIGLILATVSGILFTVNNFLFQYFTLNVTDMLLTRSVFQTLVLGLVLVVTGCTQVLPCSCLDWFLVVAQSLASAARVGLTFACLEYLPIGDALTIIFSEPLWTLMLSKLFLRTRVGWWKLSFSLVLITGVVLCTQPPVIFSSPSITHHHHHRHYHHGHEKHDSMGVQHELADSSNATQDVIPDGDRYYMGVLLALGAAISGASQNVIVAKVEQISSTALVTYSGLGGIILALAYGVLVDTEDIIIPSISMVTAEEWLTLLLLGGMGLVGFFALTRSLQLIPPTTVAVVRAMEIVLAYGVQAAVLGEFPNSLALTGSSLVIISVVAFAAEHLFLSCSARIFGRR